MTFNKVRIGVESGQSVIGLAINFQPSGTLKTKPYHFKLPLAINKITPTLKRVIVCNKLLT